MAGPGSKDSIGRLPAGKRPASSPHAVRIPKGKIEMVVTRLEMTRPPARPALHRSGKLALMRAERPTASFYRYLYNTVGGPWLWYERRCWSDEELLGVVRDPKVEIHVLHVAGVPAGFTEIDRRREDEVEIAYVGLVPEFIGQGLGPYLLGWAVDQAWSKRTRRVWVHTCNHDHPKALAVYQRAGFVPCDQESSLIDDPRAEGAMPPGQEFR